MGGLHFFLRRLILSTKANRESSQLGIHVILFRCCFVQADVEFSTGENGNLEQCTRAFVRLKLFRIRRKE